MVNSIADILREGGLPREIVDSLQEAFNKKVEEARAETEVSVREEFSRRYEHDKENLVEAMDRMLTDVISQHESEKTKAVQKFVEARNTYRKAIRESRATYRGKLNESMKANRSFVTEQLSKEVVKLREQRRAVTNERLAVAEKLQVMKESLARSHAKRLTKIDEFVVHQVKRELTEFGEDHRALVETRVKLVAESRKKLRETQARFVKEAAKNVEKSVTESLAREMTQLHEDLERNRQNMFGRRMFEAFAAEFMGSYLAEGTEIRKLQNVVESKSSELASTKAKLAETVQVAQSASRKAKLAEDRVVRSKVMGELLSNLRGEKRAVMEGMLETVKTDSLRPSFNKLLPVVLDETTRKPAPTRKALTETRSFAKPQQVNTGDLRAARRFETTQNTTNDSDDFAQIMRLAGLQK